MQLSKSFPLAWAKVEEAVKYRDIQALKMATFYLMRLENIRLEYASKKPEVNDPSLNTIEA